LILIARFKNTNWGVYKENSFLQSIQQTSCPVNQLQRNVSLIFYFFKMERLISSTVLGIFPEQTVKGKPLPVEGEDVWKTDQFVWSWLVKTKPSLENKTGYMQIIILFL